MDALSRLLMLNAPQGTIDKKLRVRKRLAASTWRRRTVGYSLACANTRCGETGNTDGADLYVTLRECGSVTTQFSASPESRRK